MADEQDKTLAALQLAIQMEIDGKEYYSRASRESSNNAGRELFEWLAGEEDRHRQRFEQIYESIKRKKAWPDIDIQPPHPERQGTVFLQPVKSNDVNVSANANELDSIARAMDMENKTEELYKKRAVKAEYDAERRFYVALAAEERGHYLALVDYREYLIDPAGWFRKMEHHSLDGG